MFGRATITLGIGPHSSWVKKCMECEVEGSTPRGRPKRTWREIVQKDCQARNLNMEDAVDRGTVDGRS